MTPEADRTTPPPFVQPTLLGVGVGLATEGVLVALLIMLALFSRPGGGAIGDAGNSAGRGHGDGVGTFDNKGLGSGNRPSDDESAPGTADQKPIEIAAGAKRPAQAPPSPAADKVGRPEPRERPAQGISTFTIAALPAPAAGQGKESAGGGAGFSDVDERLRRAGAKSGDVQISLAWNNGNDLDLHVVAPSGERIFFNDRKSTCRGELDVDMNAAGPQSNRPVENIFWPDGAAPKGRFAVLVHHYKNHGSRDPTQYHVVVKVDGETRNFSGKLTFGGQPQEVHHFSR